MKGAHELEQLEAIMRAQRLHTWPRTQDSELLALPTMVPIFLRLRQRSLHGLPTQETFLRAVMAEAPELPEAGVRARASRTYPALVRQHHFVVALRACTTLEGVYWIEGLDLTYGVDVLVLHHGRALGVALSVESATADAWAQVKRARHPPLEGLVMLHLNISPERARHVGQFWVHPLADVWEVERAMETAGLVGV